MLIAAVVFLVGILGYVGYGYYDDYKNDPLRAVVIEVNGVAFAMDYFVEALDIYVANYIGNTVNTYVDFYMQAYNVSREEAIQALTSNAVSELSLNTNDIADMITGQAADDIINGELLRQGAKNLDIEVTTAEIEAKLKEYELPDNRLYRDIMRASLLEEKLKEEYFDSGLNATMEQAQVQVVLVESEEVASELIAQVQAGGNLTALAEEFSCNFSVEGDLGWLPEELMPNALIANAAFNFTPPHLSEPIYDGAAVKDVGYWLIEVTAAHNETIDAQVMLLSSEAEAEQVRAELAAGGNFSALARTYSQHESRTQGGKLDGLKLGDMGSTAFDNVAFNITLNEVSEPVKDTLVQTTGGYWLVNVVDRGNRVLDQAVREKLVDKRYNDWRQEWAENSIIETHLDADKRTYAMNQVLARV